MITISILFLLLFLAVVSPCNRHGVPPYGIHLLLHKFFASSLHFFKLFLPLSTLSHWLRGSPGSFWSRTLSDDDLGIYRLYNFPRYGFSVRCVRD